MQLIFEIYWKIGTGLIIIWLSLHYTVVLPFLSARGNTDFQSWVTTLKHGEDLRKYGEHCLREGKPLFWYNVLTNAYKILIAWFIGGGLLLFAMMVFD